MTDAAGRILIGDEWKAVEAVADMLERTDPDAAQTIRQIAKDLCGAKLVSLSRAEREQGLDPLNELLERACSGLKIGAV